ncbi:GMC family oxidoreductase [Roseovarius aestuarii]|uniref:Alcohol dehydrogenase [acceptor] n=1 Tax=Roseovarius aestuarii TaxID=475083 RepID=A0A1X7BM07_9RHOB|nr:GMC family oxidoreductase N-terminal domain-containing protein [Roseovarius aestuarii]SMC10643.1 Alcohol dehydrogenase [acceptor] [Roseovarius aestuarii]
MTASEFDFIIIGAGSAGCVLADRLTANGNNKVLLIEAGGSDAKFWIKVPLGYGMTYADPKLNWGYNTQPDPGLKSRSIYWPRGKVIGGSSSINAMTYVRGLPQDFQDWETSGATGWGWDNVRRTYERLETSSELSPDGVPQKYGSGSLWVSDLSDQMNPFSRRFLQAANDLGWPITENMNGARPEGLSPYRSNVRNGRRWSAADAFLRPARRRRNLKVVTGALVEKLVIKEGRATSVRYKLGNQTMIAHAIREVIVSAGAINSPQLLQLSGIGPAEHLRAHGIEVHQDLGEVGKGLQDHLAISYHFRATEPTLNNILGNRRGQLLAGLKYMLTRRGPLAVPVNQVGGFLRTDRTKNTPDVQLFCNPATYSTRETGKVVIDRVPGFLLSAQPCRPTSRGSVRIQSAKVADAPVIEPNSLATESDRDMVLRAGRLLRELALSPTLAGVTKERKSPDLIRMDDDEMRDDFRARASTVFHPTCTCRMGRSAADSVLDARLRVHGVRGLRVVDASAFPNITSGNTNAPTMMLALRAADLILEDART